MAISPASKRAADEVAEASVAAEKALYAERLRALQAAVEPPLTNLELSIGLELDAPHQRPAASQVGRFLSVAPRNRRARPDRATRALIDRLVQGDAALCVHAAVAPGLPREVLVCELWETTRLGPDWARIRLGDRPLHGSAPAPEPDDDDLDFSGGADPAPHRSAIAAPPRVAAAPTPARPPVSPPESATEPELRPLPPVGARALGPWRVPPIGLGLMRLSTAGRPDEATAVALVHRALDAGVRLLDTADAYATGPGDMHHNEALVRRALDTWRGPRGEVVVATKVGLTRPDGRWVPNGRPEHLRAAVDGSLRALGVEQLDLLQLHAPDPAVPLAESLGALAELAREGKARALGVCNLRPSDVHVALEAAPLVSLQARFNPYDKASWTNGLLHTARAHGLTFIAHSPLGGHGGVGRVTRDRALGEIAGRVGASPHEVALAWIATLDPGLVLIPGATRADSVDSSARAAALALDDDARRALSARFRWSRERPAAEADAEAEADAPATSLVVGAPVPVVDITVDEVCAAPRDEVVLLMGMPALGKTSAVRRFTDAGYVRLNRDRAGGKLDDLLPILERHYEDGARRFVLDNTYTLRKMRAGVLATARRLGLPVRCVWLGGTVEDARYNAALRIFRKLGRMPAPDEIVARGKADPNTFPPAVLDRFASTAEPVDRSEGVDRVERVPFARVDPPDYTTQGLLLDLDGTLRRTKSGSPFPTAPDDVVILPGRREVLAPLVAAGVRLFGVTNQAGVSLGQVDEAVVRAACDRTAELLGLPIDVVWCPHPPGRPTCWCRKPLPGLGVALIERWRLSRADLVMVGDRPSDAAFAAGLGIAYRDATDFFT